MSFASNNVSQVNDRLLLLPPMIGVYFIHSTFCLQTQQLYKWYKLTFTSKNRWCIYGIWQLLSPTSEVACLIDGYICLLSHIFDIWPHFSPNTDVVCMIQTNFCFQWWLLLPPKTEVVYFIDSYFCLQTQHCIYDTSPLLPPHWMIYIEYMVTFFTDKWLLLPPMMVALYIIGGYFCLQKQLIYIWYEAF